MYVYKTTGIYELRKYREKQNAEEQRKRGTGGGRGVKTR
jgi:hypothetical protein